MCPASGMTGPVLQRAPWPQHAGSVDGSGSRPARPCLWEAECGVGDVLWTLFIRNKSPATGARDKETVASVGCPGVAGCRRAAGPGLLSHPRARRPLCQCRLRRLSCVVVRGRPPAPGPSWTPGKEDTVACGPSRSTHWTSSATRHAPANRSDWSGGVTLGLATSGLGPAVALRPNELPAQERPVSRSQVGAGGWEAAQLGRLSLSPWGTRWGPARPPEAGQASRWAS